MSKVAEYLNEHLQGEVTTNGAVRRQFSTDGSIITLTPDMVAFPRTTSDIRKIARFCWQLAEKGHVLSITTRGGGSDLTGASIGKGVIVNLVAHMNSIFELDAKQKLVRVQPGVTFKALNDALRMHGLYIPSAPASESYSTIGGAIANNASGIRSGKYGAIADWVHQLEIVLSNGEILQTGRLNKREYNKKMGLQTFEGEIYRGIDRILNDNESSIANLQDEMRDNTGYNVFDVRRKDGSVDLTPLFIGSQGTLGIVSEVIMKAETLPDPPLLCAFAFADNDVARDALDTLSELNPSLLELIDARMFDRAGGRGKRYEFYNNALDQGKVSAVIVAEYDQKGDHTKKKIAKKIAKSFKDMPVYSQIEKDPATAAELLHLVTVVSIPLLPFHEGTCSPLILEGAQIPPERLESFAKSLADLEAKSHVDLPLCGHAGDNVYYVRPELNFEKVSDRQKVFKLMAEWTNLVSSYDGILIGESAEGRLKSPFAYQNFDDQTVDLFALIKVLFDPMQILNPGVKQPLDTKSVVPLLRHDYHGADFAEYGPV